LEDLFWQGNIGTNFVGLDGLLKVFIIRKLHNHNLVDVDEAYHEISSKKHEKFANYSSFIKAAFDVHSNSAILANLSVEMAIVFGVAR